MKIGILTYYKVPNFGANLQAISTYNYLKKQGHDVIFLYYLSHYTDYVRRRTMNVSEQQKVHFDFINDNLPQDGEKLFSSHAVLKAIQRNNIDAVIIGSDAVLQHFPLFSTLKWGQSLKAWLRPIEGERRFPNTFWGCGISDKIPTAMISVSSQNSPYKKWTSWTKNRMSICLRNLKYISVRDTWTRDLVLELVGLRGNVLPETTIHDIELKLKDRGIECISFPIGHVANLPYKKAIKYPLNPIDWYALIKYASAYIGNNMHPIVVSLHNAVPCFSIDNWGSTNFWGKRLDDGSSKVQDILVRYELPGNRMAVDSGHCEITADEIISMLDAYDKTKVAAISELQFNRFDEMMKKCLKSLA